MTNPPRAFAKRFFGVACLALFLSAGAALAQVPTTITHPPNGIGESTIGHPAIANVPTTITHQGRLFDSGTPPTGTYDMQFKLYDTAMVGTGMLQGSPNTVTLPTVNVTNGIFTVQLDFGASAFPGADRFLEINVRHPGDPAYTTLAPRTQLTSAPYAIRSLSAASADNATTATTATNNVLKSGDTMTGQLVLSGDPSVALGAATKQYVDNAGATKLNLSGGTMTGQLVLSGDPSVALGAATKQYVDASAGGSTGANYVFAYDTTVQLVAVANTFQDITFNTNAQLNGWTHTAGTASFSCPQTGLYLIQYAAEIGALLSDDISVRATVNGTEAPGSRSAGKIALVSRSFMASLNAADVLRLQFTDSAGTAQLGNGEGPTVPSASITIVKIH
jgi:hypothetical protein